jgi:FAD/FMN-containing dehydrogenase
VFSESLGVKPSEGERQLHKKYMGRDETKLKHVQRKRRGRWWRLALAAVVAITAVGFWLYETADSDLDSSLGTRQVVDFTHLQRIQVRKVLTPTTTEEVVAILRSHKGAVSIGGARASMGGQIAEPGSIHLDMRQMNKVVAFAPERREITVQAGMRWRDVQEAIDPHDLSVRIMQTYANFTVGGSLGVNAHGRYMGRGPLVLSVQSIEVVLANGDVVFASPRQNSELFYGVIGGYGGLGVVTQATLALDINEKVERSTHTFDTAEYVEYFRTQIRDDPRVIFHNADLRPPDFATGRAVSWLTTDAELTNTDRLIPRNDTYKWSSRIINNMVDIPGGHLLRRWVFEPLLFSSKQVTWRNHEASYDIAELEPADRKDVTYVLREYFVPAERFDEFVPKMRNVFSKYEVDVINVSVRHAHADPGTLLAWARGETFAFVVYYQQETTPEAIDKVGEWSRAMVDEVLSVGGTYYLPYQNHATGEQFERAYPRAAEYFALKRRVDPKLRFQNQLWYHYGPNPRAERDEQLQKLGYERKPEGQTLLTIPEWYLVWNPGEYTAHLRAGKPPDEFPFFASVREYWSLYKKVLTETEGLYSENDEYLTMLRVIGVSTTVEYVLKGAYEATVGRLFRSFATGGAPSQEQTLITQAFGAYERLIYDEPWYVFDFVPWIGKIWRETPLWGPDILRRTERKVAFSAEFALKGAYATLLGWAAQSAYDAAATHIDVVASIPDGVEHAGMVRRAEITPHTHWIQIERWKEFSEVIPALAYQGVDFVEIAGNDDIAVSLLETSGQNFHPSAGQRLFTSRIVTDPERTRAVWFVPVDELGAFLRQARQAELTLEHLYDY